MVRVLKEWQGSPASLGGGQVAITATCHPHAAFEGKRVAGEAQGIGLERGRAADPMVHAFRVWGKQEGMPLTLCVF